MFQLRSIRSRILIYAIVPAAIVIAAIIWVFQFSMRINLTQMARIVVKQKLIAVAEEIDKRNLEAITITKTMALAQQNGLFGNRSASIRYAQEILRDNPKLHASYFGYEPDADGTDAATLSTTPAGEKAASKDSI